MMRSRRPRIAALAWATLAVALGACVNGHADDTDTNHQLNLADLADYRAALDGKATAQNAQADGAPRVVRFRDLWDNSQAFLGRRVTIQGRVERIFRQAAVGQFPPLAEVWIVSPAGDPFCLVFAQHEPTTGNDQRDQKNRPDVQSGKQKDQDIRRAVPEVGQTVRFTGTFLKMVSYVAPDGKRLAPLIVGDRPPVDQRDGPTRAGVTASRERSAEVFETIGGRDSRAPRDDWPGSGASLALAIALAALALGIIAWRHIHTPARRPRFSQLQQGLPEPGDPPLEFIDTQTPLGGQVAGSSDRYVSRDAREIQ